MEFKGLRVLESWNRTRKLWVLKIAILFTKPCGSDLNSTLLREIPAISSRHVWKIAWMYLNSAVSLHPSKHAAPAPLNFQRNSHGFLCVCVCVCWKGTGCITGLILQLWAVNFYGISEFFLVGGENGEAGWGREEKNYVKAEFLREVVHMGGSKCFTTNPPLSPEWKSAQIPVCYL